VKNPPRLIVRTLAVTLVTVSVILAIVFLVLTLDVRERARATEIAKLQLGERVFQSVEEARQREQLAMMTAIAKQPEVKAALDTYLTEVQFGGVTPEHARQLLTTVTRAIEDVATSVGSDAVALLDTGGRVFAAAGRARNDWPLGAAPGIGSLGQRAFHDVALLPGDRAFRVTGAALTLDGDRDVGSMVLATSLDANYAQQLSHLAGAGVVIVVRDRVTARTVAEDVTRDLLAGASDSRATRTLGEEEYAVRTLFAAGPVRIYALNSIDAPARSATRDALVTLGSIALGGFMLTVLGSVWLARTLTHPIDAVASSIATMTAARDFNRTIEPTGTSRELDALAAAFNDLMHGLHAAEAETRAAYLGVIRALAAALDARDPYTAGHSERVSALSVLMARQLTLDEKDVDVIRLGALLHDIGKIGVSDEVLRKPGPLTPDEFEQIKRHPALGARILRQVPFLAPHLPIVELHHERPDGRGYPFGLRAEDIPLAARIVHVADAFDAMTSARAYRPARGRAFAVSELRRCAGTEFDASCVEALVAALDVAPSMPEPQLQQLLGRGA
jgi:putative nucleotidyltransferase with HDIG domain